MWKTGVILGPVADVCPVDGSAKFSLSPITADDPLVGQYIAMCEAEGIEVAGIEFVEDAEGRRYTYDINGTTNSEVGACPLLRVNTAQTAPDFFCVKFRHPRAEGFPDDRIQTSSDGGGVSSCLLVACDDGDSGGDVGGQGGQAGSGGVVGGAGGEAGGGAGGGDVPDMDVPEPDADLRCAANADCVDDPAGPACDVESGECVGPPPGGLIGWGDGSPESVELTLIYQPAGEYEAPDLELHPTRANELWVVNRHPNAFGSCTERTMFGERCAALPGFTTLIFNPGTDEQREEILEDGNAWHFMRRPPALAMGANDTFATCGEAATGNFENESAMFIGPSLWSSDLDIYAQDPGPGLNGSHLDMLHATPWCSGIAHERDNVYWLFNGHVGSIDRYDFVQDHGPGYDDHSDGIISRYVEGELSRVPDVPGHMQFNPDSPTTAPTSSMPSTWTATCCASSR